MLRLNWQDHEFGSVARHHSLKASVEDERGRATYRVTVGSLVIGVGHATTVTAAKHAAEADVLLWLQGIQHELAPLFPEARHHA